MSLFVNGDSWCRLVLFVVSARFFSYSQLMSNTTIRREISFWPYATSTFPIGRFVPEASDCRQVIPWERVRNRCFASGCRGGDIQAQRTAWLNRNDTPVFAVIIGQENTREIVVRSMQICGYKNSVYVLKHDGLKKIPHKLRHKPSPAWAWCCPAQYRKSLPMYLYFSRCPTWLLWYTGQSRESGKRTHRKRSVLNNPHAVHSRRPFRNLPSYPVQAIIGKEELFYESKGHRPLSKKMSCPTCQLLKKLIKTFQLWQPLRTHVHS